ncbi:DNA-binding FadR family transcriptional regulator [Microbacteriaceae bacterium SG_E_30_P1]|uniref:DNA-binding FadR family transcriptional regulator n=1 Tax=Antiquaquibacter oligotrophicus TaxID=2880260 RepID=A0ABT6KL40_9MICO|nr:FadR/GntR family transcriptional regulator [Antiquaquibacter oligotrophicus]MDH6180173.1 DNA-binding FadR family transcriptional regulator [Antiquaquibacter oligotrophicus]UDF14075.1 FadR family transcriptional regulator [Antiquaquibacter oligotrophicus]
MSEHVASPVPLRRSVLGGSDPRTPPARLGVAVVADLVAAIVTGELEPGDVLPPESTLSQRFGVSRTVIRESVKRVEEKGLVVVAQGRGTTVNPPSAWNVLDPVVLSALVDHDDTLGVLDELTIVRASLEASMSAEAARRLSPESSADLQNAFDETAKHLGDFDAYNDADAAFHYLIMEQSGIRLAANITRILFARARESARFTGNQGPEAMDITLDEHRRILEAILQGDADGAAQAMQEHIASAWARRRPKDEPKRS